MFVLSEAGKPIYSRYGSVEALSTTMGVMTALVSFVQSAGDAIRAIYAGEQRWGRGSGGSRGWWTGKWLAGRLSTQPSVYVAGRLGISLLSVCLACWVLSD